jgi:hypothetical protein
MKPVTVRIVVRLIMRKRSRKAKSPAPAYRIAIVGEGRDESGNRYFKFAVAGSDVDLPPYSMKQILKNRDDIFTDFANAGVVLVSRSAQNQFINLVQERKPRKPKFKVVTMLGWNSGAIVRPDGIIGKPTIQLERHLNGLDPQMLAKYRVGGTLEDWQSKIVSLCTGNSRLIFAASLAFTGPILRFVSGPRGGGFNLSGSPESGKTTAQMVTGSVWGCHISEGNNEIGFAETWHTTTNKVEVTALAHNDCVLLLDETMQAGETAKKRAEVVPSTVMALAQNREKDRMTNAASARWWLFYFLSTSNFSLDELARQGGVTINDAHRSRLTEICLPAAGCGIYEKLHGFESGEKLTDALIKRCRTYFGAAGRAFQKKLVAASNSDLKQLRKWIARRRDIYSKALKREANAKGLRPLKRSTGRCATVYAAGRLAIKYGLLPWSRKQLLRAILSCQLDQPPPTETTTLNSGNPVDNLRQTLVNYLRERRGEFMDLDNNKPRLGPHVFGSVPGYSATFKTRKWLYLTDAQLRGILGTGPDVKRLKATLSQEDLMARTAKGRFLVQRPVFTGARGNKGHRRVHAFDARIIAKTGD